MLVEIALGDSYGHNFEYVDPQIIKEYNDGKSYRQHPTHLKLKPGMYTDDTQQSIALAELVIEGAEWNPLTIANKFVEVFRRDQRDGYSRGFQKILEAVHTGAELLKAINGNSDRSGGAMRAAPCGAYPNMEECLDKAEIQAKVTHNSEVGIASAKAAALMSWYFHNTVRPKDEVGNFLNEKLPGWMWNVPWGGKVRMFGNEPVRAAITAIRFSNSKTELLRNCVAFTGDVDTVCAIAMGCAAPCHELKYDLDSNLFSSLEQGEYGLNYLLDLDKKLISPEKADEVREPWKLAPGGWQVL